LAIELGEKSGLCIVGFVRGEKMNVYTHAERLA
jgi:formate dehydrogenase assembly factor FdhD